MLLLAAAIVYLADVVSKIIVVATLPHHQVRLLGGLVTLLILRNSGAAFSIGTSMTVVFTLIAVGVITFILRTSRRLRSAPWAITLGLLLGGATGNLTDRIFRSPGLFRGNVVDWIQWPHWPVFNIADSAIVCGGVLAVLLAARGLRLDGTRDGHPAPDPDGPGESPPGAGERQLGAFRARAGHGGPGGERDGHGGSVRPGQEDRPGQPDPREGGLPGRAGPPGVAGLPPARPGSGDAASGHSRL